MNARRVSRNTAFPSRKGPDDFMTAGERLPGLGGEERVDGGRRLPEGVALPHPQGQGGREAVHDGQGVVQQGLRREDPGRLPEGLLKGGHVDG
jgi:hypothetical protein